MAAFLATACLVWPALHAAPAQGAFPALDQPAVMRASASSSAMLAVARAGARVVMGGERGVILWSDDQGGTWRQAVSPVRVTITALAFADDQHGWALGHLGVILHTSDGGQTWRRQMDGRQLAGLFAAAADAVQDPAAARQARDYAKLLEADGPDKPWLGLSFSDARHGVVVGAYNLAMTTQDGGATWQPLSYRLPNPKALHLYGVKVNGQTVLVHGEQGLLLRSEDGGATFSALASPYKGTWFGMLPLEDDGWLVYGLRGNAFQTRDGGSSWTVVPTGLNASITAGRRLHDGRLILLTQTGDLLISAPGTTGFEQKLMSVGSAAGDLVETADGNLVVATLRGPVRAALSAGVR